MPEPRTWISVNVINDSGDMITFNDEVPTLRAELLEERLASLHEQAKEQDGDRCHAVFVRARKNRTPLIIRFRIPEEGVEEIRRIFRDEE